MSPQHSQISVSSSSDSAHDSSSLFSPRASTASVSSPDSCLEGSFSARQFDHQSGFTESVLTLLEQWHQSTSSDTEYTFTEVPLHWGGAVYDAVDEKWRLRLYPSIAFEVGWSESEEELAADAELLLRGSGGLTHMVVTVKWTASLDTRTVTGTLQVWRLSQREQPFISHSQTIFPASSPPQPQYLEFTLADVFLSAVPQGRSPTDVLRCDINLLRRYATEAFQKMNFRPA
ncbi:uncharacterized protein N7515_007367 [Penicillium bovifimosum]|uniref:Uncharacterized protein n=1 Tax=Penicillium bovifimosum TaxID=126998 RepID=A0A9W9L0M4_9EURO|nr:uncharacterized protein N7515_007367 [Penicillium bovifimosum]KAJ5131328.1 hypothetical protein N7515_007367 [Penicillium bovifimosum]